MRLTVLHSSDLTKERPRGFYVCAELDDDEIKVFTQCTFLRRRDAEMAMNAMTKAESLDRILKAADQNLEARKVMCEALQW